MATKNAVFMRLLAFRKRLMAIKTKGEKRNASSEKAPSLCPAVCADGCLRCAGRGGGGILEELKRRGGRPAFGLRERQHLQPFGGDMRHGNRTDGFRK